ncbi:MAG TPA: hypothetical protein VMN99_15695 [Anaerolineales bacterium]|nr:hypothetical protein [Anaerolineales bacterium]
MRSALWLAMWLKGERAGVRESVKAALDKFSKASIVDYSAYLIHSHLAEIVFLALEEGRKDDLPKTQMDEVEKYARVAIKNMKNIMESLPSAGLRWIVTTVNWNGIRTDARRLISSGAPR